MFEERKWKKGIYHILANQIETKIKKSNRKKKLDELYKRCMCLYLSMNINNDLADISMGKENKNISQSLNNYIKTISNAEYLEKQFTHWKESLSQIKEKLQKKFGEKNLNKAKNFLRVVKLMEKMVIFQEDTVKRLVSNKEQNFINDENLAKNYQDQNFSHNGNWENNFTCDVEMNFEKQLYTTDEMMSYKEMVKDNMRDLDINNLSKELNGVIEEMVNEINSQEETDIFLEMNVNDLISFCSVGNKLDSQTTKLSESELISQINPKQLFYDTSSTYKNSEELKSYLEKVLKVESEKIEILPDYIWNKILNSTVNINKDIDNFTKIYLKVFPSIYFTDEHSIDKEVLESEIDVYKMKYERILKDFEQNKLFNFKFNNFTTLQKLILIWGICTYGSNLPILTEIPNIFTFTKSISFENEEVFIELDKLLSELGIDLLASNFESVGMKTISSHFIYNLDPPMLNSSQCNFYYNKNILNYINKNEKEDTSEKENNLDIGFSKFETTENSENYEERNKIMNSLSPYKSTYRGIHISPKINLINHSPVFKDPEKKLLMLQNLKDDLKKICIRVDGLYENSLNLHASIDFSTMTRKQKDNYKVNNKKSSSSNSSNSLTASSISINTSEVLNLLMSQNFDFSVKKLSESTLDNTRPNVRQDTLEGVSFYSQPSIQKEWDILRTQWYQNNIQFKPKFRKPCKIN